MMDRLEVKSKSFEDNGYMQKKNTGFGEDISPDFELLNLVKDAKSIVIVMDDLDIPFIKEYNHWLIWNLPPIQEISEAISHGADVPDYGAKQGIGYGKHRYRGPFQPVFVRNMHRYKFSFYVLDTLIELDASSRKKDVLKVISRHILQEGSIIGKYKR